MSGSPLRPLREGVTQVELDGEVCLYSPVQGEVLFLNPAASAVWHLVDGTRTLDQVVDELAARYAVPAETIAPDVEEAVRSLRDRGLVLPDRTS